MKKVFSIVLFSLLIAFFIFDLCFSIAGAIDIDKQFANFEARGAGGHVLLGVGLDIFVFAAVLATAVGFGISIISRKIAQYRALRIASGVMFLSFLIPILISVLILTL